MVAFTRTTGPFGCASALGQTSGSKVRDGGTRAALRTRKLRVVVTSRAKFVNFDEAMPEGERKSKESSDKSKGSLRADKEREESDSPVVSEDMKNAESLLAKPQEMVEHFRFWTKCIHGQGAIVSVNDHHESIGAST